MKLLRLEITGFGGLRERTVEFGPGLTLLLGPNEAGKSTVLACLSQVLFGKPSQRSLFPDFTPWDGGPFAAALIFEQDGMRYRLTRRFSESGAKAQALHRLKDDDAEELVTQETAAIRERVAAWFGSADDRIFYRVFCLAQTDLTPLDNFDGLREHLERAVSGAETAVTTAVQKIDARLATLRRGVGQPALPQNWGALKRAMEARQEWDTRLLDANRQQRQLAEKRIEVQRAQEEIAGYTERNAIIPGLLEADRRRRELAERLQSLKADWGKLEEERERVKYLQDDHARLCRIVSEHAPAYADPSALRNRIAAAQQAKGSPAGIGWGIIALGVALGLAVFFLARNPLAFLITLTGVIVGLPIVLGAGRRARAVAAICAECAVASPTEALNRLEAVERDRRDLDAVTMAMNAVADAGQLTERSRALTLEIASVEQKLSEIPGTPLSAEEAHKLASELRRMTDALPAVQERERQLTREIAVLEQAERDLIDLEDGVAYWKAATARAKDEEAALLLAKELLTAAGQQAHAALADPLAARITPLFAAMTGGRYPGVRVKGDAKALDVRPLDAEDTPIAPDQLSKGTRDQFILAVRLALGQALAGEDGSPVFLLDDPLLHFDADRRQEALAMLSRLAEDTQIILATHDDRLAAELPDAQVVRVDDAVSAPN